MNDMGQLPGLAAVGRAGEVGRAFELRHGGLRGRIGCGSHPHLLQHPPGHYHPVMLEPHGGAERFQLRRRDLEQLKAVPDRVDEVGVRRIGGDRILVVERERIVFLDQRHRLAPAMSAICRLADQHRMVAAEDGRIGVE